MSLFEIIEGDCRNVLSSFEDHRFDAILTDPPYDLTKTKRKRPTPRGAGPYARHRVGTNGDHDRLGGFMGHDWDATRVAFEVETWKTMLRVSKPGAHMLAFGHPRTYHRMVVAIEDAGWEIRDSIDWIYGTGYPKSYNLEEEHEGYGTGLKPAHEPIVLARAPMIGSVEQNLARFGTGVLDIDSARVPRGTSNILQDGGWPANVVLTHAIDCATECAEGCPVARMDEQSGDRVSGKSDGFVGSDAKSSVAMGAKRSIIDPSNLYDDHGGASRYFNTFEWEDEWKWDPFLYVAKPSPEERDLGLAHRKSEGRRGDKRARANIHPTVKPIALLRHLIRMAVPKRGLVLDPFLGSGSTAIAALREQRRVVGIEGEPIYVQIARERIEGDAPLFHRMRKAAE